MPRRLIITADPMKDPETEESILLEGTDREQYEELVQELLSYNWHPKLVLMAPPKAFPEEKTGKVGYDTVDEPIRDAIRSTVSAVGEKYGLQVVDLYAFTEKHPEYFGDGVHPNVPGNEAIAQHLYETLSV